MKTTKFINGVVTESLTDERYSSVTKQGDNIYIEIVRNAKENENISNLKTVANVFHDGKVCTQILLTKTGAEMLMHGLLHYLTNETEFKDNDNVFTE